MTTPWQRYQQDLQSADFSHDSAQERVVCELQTLYERLLSESGREKPARRWFQRRSSAHKQAGVDGLYIWGGVGRGKTYLVDCFYDSLPFQEKRRRHFHRFMQDVHVRLVALGQISDPLDVIADEIAANTRVLCFDEFFVSDITDAMILAGLMQGLFRNGVTLVATSNIAPDGLYKGGLQRARFLPAIDLIKQHCSVTELASDNDYRLRALVQAEIFHTPLDAAAEQNMQRYFEQINPQQGEVDGGLEINHRQISSRKIGDGIVWCDFDALCNTPRSHTDYIELSRCFHTVLLSNVPVMNRDAEDQARRFISLVDEFYDRSVKLIISAAEPIESLYQGTRLAFEYQRTASRLQEMQSEQYLAAAHKP